MIKKINQIINKAEEKTGTDIRYIARGGGWITAGSIISSLTSLALIYVFGNFIEQRDYGIYQYVLSIATILATPTLRGMNIALTKAVAQGYEGTFKKGLHIKLRWGVLSTLASIGTAGYYYINENITLTISFLSIAIFLPFMFSFGAYNSYLEGKKDFKLSSVYKTLEAIIRAGILITVILVTKNILVILFTHFAISTLIRSVFLIKIYKKINNKVDITTIRYGKHLSLMKGFSSIVSSLDNILLFHFLGAAQVAIYSFAKTPVTKASSLLSPIVTLAFPKFAEQSSDNLKKFLPRKILYFFGATLILTITYIILAPTLYNIFLPQYLDSVIYSQIFALSLLFFPQKLLVSALTAQQQQKSLYIIEIVNPILRIALLVVLLPLYGILGVVLAYLIPLAVNGVMLFYFFKRM